MVKYTIKRVIWLFLMLFIIFTSMYIIMAMVQIHNFGPRPRMPFFDNFDLAFKSYKIYLTNIVTDWNWGYEGDTQVWDIFMERMPLTLRINVVVLVSFIVIGSLLGIISALKKHSITDAIISSTTMVFNSIPPIFLIFPLIVIFGYQLEILPRFFPVSEPRVSQRILGYVIPIIALGGPAVSSISKLVRGELVESISAEYMTLARVKGLSRRQAIVRHGFRNAMVPIIPEIPTLFMGVLMSSFFIESVYNINGLANWYLKSMYRQHFGSGYFFIMIPNAMIISLFYASLVISLNVITDISLGLVDPRIHMGQKD